MRCLARWLLFFTHHPIVLIDFFKVVLSTVEKFDVVNDTWRVIVLVLYFILTNKKVEIVLILCCAQAVAPMTQR